MRRFMSVLLAAAMVAGLSLPVFASGASTVKSALALVNEERKAAGVAPIAWDETLAEAAKVRAEELGQKYTTNHTRPDGSKYYTTSLLIWGENTAYGHKSAERAVEALIKSSGHRANIVKADYTIFAMAYIETDEDIYWVQEFGNGKSNAVWTGNTEASVTVGGMIGKDGKVASENLVAELNTAIAASKSGAVSVRIKDAAAISPAAKQAGRAAALNFDTMSSNGKTVQGRLVVNPAKLTKRVSDLSLGVYTDKAATGPLKTSLAKRYSNDMAVVSLAQKGSLGAAMKVSAKADLSGLNQDNLRFWNDDGKTLTEIQEPKYSVDKNGFVSFYTSIGGVIVITDKDLAVK